MSDLQVTVDQNGVVQSAVSASSDSKKCPSCKRVLSLSAYFPDMRTMDKLSPTCRTCREKGIMTRAEAKAGRPLSSWSMGRNNPAAVTTFPAKQEPVKEAKPETSQQKVFTLMTLILEALDEREQRMLIRMLKAAGETDD